MCGRSSKMGKQTSPERLWAVPLATPRGQCRPSWLEDRELDRSFRLSLDDRSALSDGITARQIASAETNQVEAPQLAVDREIEHGTVSKMDAGDSRQKRIAQTSLSFSALFGPTFRPTFHTDFE